MRPRQIASEIPRKQALLFADDLKRFNEAEADRLGNPLLCALLTSGNT